MIPQIWYDVPIDWKVSVWIYNLIVASDYKSFSLPCLNVITGKLQIYDFIKQIILSEIKFLLVFNKNCTTALHKSLSYNKPCYLV